MPDLLGIWNLDWPNANSQRKYPLHPTATAVDTSGTFTLPTDILVGLYLPVPANADFNPEKVFLKTVGVYPSSLVVYLAYDDGAATLVATAVVPLAGLAEYGVFPLSGVNAFADVQGTVQIGRPDSIANLSVGEFQFDPAGGRLDADVVRPVLPAVTGLVLVNGQDRSDTLTGVIYLTAGNNVRLTATPVYGASGSVGSSESSGGQALIGHRVRIDAIDGAGLTDDCLCTGQEPTGDPIRTINGQPPDANGNFNLTGSDCIKVETAAGAATLTDDCSKPCCGLEAVDKITADLQKLGAERSRQAAFLDQLNAAVSQLSTSTATLKLNDAACSDASSEGA